MNEIELKNKIIQSLKDYQKVLSGFRLTEAFIRGYILGSELTGIKIPCHWYDEIITEVMSDNKAGKMSNCKNKQNDNSTRKVFKEHRTQ